MMKLEGDGERGSEETTAITPQVWLRVTCPYPERVLNLCSARKLAFWDLEWEGTETFTCRMSRGDHRILSRAAEKLDCTIEIVRREGAPYTLAKLRHRQALAVGIAACGAAVLIGSFFVWDIQIAGNETVPREVILRSLEKNGVHRGCFGFALNGEDIRNHVLLEIPELSGPNSPHRVPKPWLWHSVRSKLTVWYQIFFSQEY